VTSRAVSINSRAAGLIVRFLTKQEYPRFLESSIPEILDSSTDKLDVRTQSAGSGGCRALLSPAKAPPGQAPTGSTEIKHDGFRIMARCDAKGVRLITRNGNDFTKRFPLVVAAVAALPVHSCLIDVSGRSSLQCRRTDLRRGIGKV
jgi:bifunctional non-homologous end joining protein LigD